jgi:hypothetical protein
MAWCPIIDATHSNPRDKNPLWREDYLYTGELRGHVTTATKPMKPVVCSTSPLPTLLKGGGGGGEVTSMDPPPPLVEKLLHFRSKRGKIRIDLGEPKVEEPGTALVRRTVRASSSNSTTTTNNNYTRTATLIPLSRKALESSSTLGGHQNIELSLSVDPLSLVRLGANLAKTSVGVLGAFAATLRLLAPMIVARRCLTTVGYACYDYYNGRYLRTTYNKRLLNMQEYEIPSALRAFGRVGVQLVAMGLAGSITPLLLNRSLCWMPKQICEYWYGMVWILSVLGAARGADLLVRKMSKGKAHHAYGGVCSFFALTHLLACLVVCLFVDGKIHSPRDSHCGKSQTVFSGSCLYSTLAFAPMDERSRGMDQQPDPTHRQQSTPPSMCSLPTRCSFVSFHLAATARLVLLGHDSSHSQVPYHVDVLLGWNNSDARLLYSIRLVRRMVSSVFARETCRLGSHRQWGFLFGYFESSGCSV